MQRYEVNIVLHSELDREELADKILEVLPANAALTIMEIPGGTNPRG